MHKRAEEVEADDILDELLAHGEAEVFPVQLLQQHQVLPQGDLPDAHKQIVREKRLPLKASAAVEDFVWHG